MICIVMTCIILYSKLSWDTVAEGCRQRHSTSLREKVHKGARCYWCGYISQLSYLEKFIYAFNHSDPFFFMRLHLSFFGE